MEQEKLTTFTIWKPSAIIEAFAENGSEKKDTIFLLKIIIK